ncbi:MAG: hypothetical protein ACI8ZX_001544 [Planctomycetota bacterium]|jgi:hypothetical protein|tara:strand:- start:545 stop:667 length:123 start_codon:yes stop_codon:yes gene_type:complete
MDRFIKSDLIANELLKLKRKLAFFLKNKLITIEEEVLKIG